MRIDFDDFLAWIASHADDEVIGLPGQCFHSPLACYLSSRMGRVYGVEGMRYGWALADECRWFPLPRWAQLFSTLSETWFGRALTALQAIDLLIRVEGMLLPVVLVA